MNEWTKSGPFAGERMAREVRCNGTSGIDILGSMLFHMGRDLVTTFDANPSRSWEKGKSGKEYKRPASLPPTFETCNLSTAYFIPHPA